LNKKYSLGDIAKALGRSVSTISEEISRNSIKGKYCPKVAQNKMSLRRRNASFRGQKIVSCKELKDFIEKNLLDRQSPEAIAGRLKYQEKKLPYVSKDTIYRFLNSPYGSLIKFKLDKEKKKRFTRKRSSKEKLKDRVFIDKRPKIVEKRGRVGDLEADFIISGKSGKGVLLVATDRRLRASFLEIIHQVSIDEVHKSFTRIKNRFPEMETITLDNDLLFNMHRSLAKLLKATIYFCHPYHSWEKGGVENTNMHIRKYIPKGSNLLKYDKQYIEKLEKKLNNRFLKCLRYATPQERLNKHRKRKKNKREKREKTKNND
jgi:IS30 family transposase